MGVLKAIFSFLRALAADRAALATENLALRQQLAIFRPSVKQPRLHPRDRVLWVWLSRLWEQWRSCLVIVQPETVIAWHCKGLKLYWRWRSRSKNGGRSSLDAEVSQLIRRMWRGNPTWGAPRIESELALLGYVVAESTVSEYMVQSRKPPMPWGSPDRP